MSAEAQTRELLAWIDARPRTYAEAIDAWKTSCPHLSVWDDALIEGLVRILREPPGPATFVVTSRGRGALATPGER